MSGSRYEPWHIRHKVQSHHYWCKLEELVLLLIEARRINFYDGRERQSIDVNANLRRVRFDAQNRFPDGTGAPLVNVTEGRCAQLLDQMRHSLNLDEDLLLMNYASAHRAAKDYTQTVQNLLGILSSLGNNNFDPEVYNIHDRMSFERKYELTWVEGSPISSNKFSAVDEWPPSIQ